MRVEPELRTWLMSSPTEWRWKTYQRMSRIPRGKLATYGRIAELVNHDHNLHIHARNVAWLRRELYGWLSHNTDFPLHRISKADDVESLHDSRKTKQYNDRLRKAEGSLQHPRWL